MPRKSKIIEFNGLPAVGKTSISNKLIEDLCKENYNVLNFNEFYRKQNLKIVFLKSILKFKFLYIKYFVLLFMFTFNNNVLSFKNFKKIIGYTIHFVIFNYVYCYEEFDYIILDQGIIQRFISVLYNSKLKSSTMVSKIYDFIISNYNDYLFIHVKLKKRLVITRLNKRKNGRSRLDFLNNKNLEMIIDIQNKNFKQIRSLNNKIDFIDINAINKKKYNSRLIINYIIND